MLSACMYFKLMCLFPTQTFFRKVSVKSLTSSMDFFFSKHCKVLKEGWPPLPQIPLPSHVRLLRWGPLASLTSWGGVRVPPWEAVLGDAPPPPPEYKPPGSSNYVLPLPPPGLSTVIRLLNIQVFPGWTKAAVTSSASIFSHRDHSPDSAFLS